MPELARPNAKWTPPERLARYRALLSRRRPSRVVLALIAAALVYTSLQSNNSRVAAVTAGWDIGAKSLVVVAPVAAGELIPSSAVELRPVPANLQPGDSVANLTDGARARVSLVPGEILRAERVVAGVATAVAARLPDGSRGVAFPVELSFGLTVGATVDLHSMLTGQSVAVAATVVRVDDDGSTIAVEASRVDDVVDAMATGGIVVALAG